MQAETESKKDKTQIIRIRNVWHMVKITDKLKVGILKGESRTGQK